MSKTKERRAEKRLHYELPVWYGDDSGRRASQGVMVNLSNRGMAFTCGCGESCPCWGQKLVVRFDIPDIESESGSGMKNFTRSGQVCRVDKLNNDQCRVAVHFDEPPPFWNEQP